PPPVNRLPRLERPRQTLRGFGSAVLTGTGGIWSEYGFRGPEFSARLRNRQIHPKCICLCDVRGFHVSTGGPEMAPRRSAQRVFWASPDPEFGPSRNAWTGRERSTMNWARAREITLFLLRVVSGLLFFQAGALKIFGWFGGMPAGQALTPLGIAGGRIPIVA